MLALLLTIAITGLVVWAITTFIPMPDKFKLAIYAVAGVCLLLYPLSVFGVLDIPVPSFRHVHH